MTKNSNIDMKFWPRGICCYTENSKSYKLRFNIKNKHQTEINCNLSTMKELFENKVLPVLRADNENFDEDNVIYQKLLNDYVNYCVNIEDE
jgi:hypothetical protein